MPNIEKLAKDVELYRQKMEPVFIEYMNSNRGLYGDEPVEWSLLRNEWRMSNGSKPFTKDDMDAHLIG